MSTAAPLLSLLLATVDRTAPLERFLDALAEQTYRNLELVVVDQNADDRVRRMLAARPPAVPMTLLRSERGLSRARNVGLPAARGELVAFPDDDCWYAPTLLEAVVGRFQEHSGWDGVCGRPGDERGVLSHSRWHSAAGTLTRFNVWHRAMSPTIFLRRRVVDAVGSFDERLGPGAETGLHASDETDYLLRAIELGFRLEYDPSLLVYHPDPPIDASPAERPFTYGRSMGAVLRKHRFPPWYTAYACLRPLGGAAVAFGFGRRQRARFHLRAFQGRLAGAVRAPISPSGRESYSAR